MANLNRKRKRQERSEAASLRSAEAALLRNPVQLQRDLHAPGEKFRPRQRPVKMDSAE